MSRVRNRKRHRTKKGKGRRKALTLTAQEPFDPYRAQRELERMLPGIRDWYQEYRP